MRAYQWTFTDAAEKVVRAFCRALGAEELVQHALLPKGALFACLHEALTRWDKVLSTYFPELRIHSPLLSGCPTPLREILERSTPDWICSPICMQLGMQVGAYWALCGVPAPDVLRSALGGQALGTQVRNWMAHAKLTPSQLACSTRLDERHLRRLLDARTTEVVRQKKVLAQIARGLGHRDLAPAPETALLARLRWYQGLLQVRALLLDVLGSSVLLRLVEVLTGAAEAAFAELRENTEGAREILAKGMQCRAELRLRLLAAMAACPGALGPVAHLYLDAELSPDKVFAGSRAKLLPD